MVIPAAPAIDRAGPLLCARFRAMAGPCEVLIETTDSALARRVANAVASEARRVEAAFSRYDSASELSRLNDAAGTRISVSEEMALLLDFAAECHAVSDGAFDITSGVLRKVWQFDGGDRIPAQACVDALLPYVGWHRLDWRSPTLDLPAGMQIDLGGIGKEYAVDRALGSARALTDCPVLVNFGGDLHVSGPPASGAWQVGVERTHGGQSAPATIALQRGALATSGDARRFVLRDGVRYGHVLDPRTGWPVVDAPASVTVAAGTCVEAGMLATLALLQGRGAEAMLEQQVSNWWCER